jgi:putative transposase
LASLLGGSSAGELILELARHGLEHLIEREAAAVLGTDRYERTEERSGYRNDSRPRLLTTQVGDIPLSIPKLRAGSFFPKILEPRRGAVLLVQDEHWQLEGPRMVSLD